MCVDLLVTSVEVAVKQRSTRSPPSGPSVELSTFSLTLDFQVVFGVPYRESL